jgi:hypothetical protein
MSFHVTKLRRRGAVRWVWMKRMRKFQIFRLKNNLSFDEENEREILENGRAKITLKSALMWVCVRCFYCVDSPETSHPPISRWFYSSPPPPPTHHHRFQLIIWRYQKIGIQPLPWWREIFCFLKWITFRLVPVTFGWLRQNCKWQILSYSFGGVTNNYRITVWHNIDSSWTNFFFFQVIFRCRWLRGLTSEFPTTDSCIKK